MRMMRRKFDSSGSFSGLVPWLPTTADKYPVPYPCTFLEPPRTTTLSCPKVLKVRRPKIQNHLWIIVWATCDLNIICNQCFILRCVKSINHALILDQNWSTMKKVHIYSCYRNRNYTSWFPLLNKNINKRMNKSQETWKSKRDPQEIKYFHVNLDRRELKHLISIKNRWYGYIHYSGIFSIT